MSRLIINGKKQLVGKVGISGAKNSVLPLLAATVLCKNECVLHNCPDLSDVRVALDILRMLGKKVSFDGKNVTVFAGKVSKNEIPDSLMRKMRSSVIFLGPLLADTKSAVISLPGGCELGPRPIDIHLSALKKLGANYTEENGKLLFKADTLSGNVIDLPFGSVGATENVILASVTARGVTTLNNAAREPEIVDLANFLNKAGAKITGAGTQTVIIEGVKELAGAEHTVIPDRIETATYMSFAAATGGNIYIENTNPLFLESVIELCKKTGCDIKTKTDSIIISATRGIKSVPLVKSAVFPSFPTDAGPMLISALATAKGTSVFVETVFENRYRFIPEIIRMGADITTENRVAIITGSELHGTDCLCTDLRGGAAIVTAALNAEGQSKIGNIHYLYRGYENLNLKLKGLGADIYTEEV